MPAPQNEYKITSVTFGEQWLEIGFYETRDYTKEVIDLKQRLISPTLFSAEVGAILDELADLLDRAAVHRRSPETSFRAVRTVEEGSHEAPPSTASAPVE